MGLRGDFPFLCRMLAVMENRAKLVVNVVHEVVTNINAEKLVKIWEIH